MASSKEDRKVRRQEWRVGLHDEELLRMLHLLRFSRYFDERLEALYRQGRLPGAFYSGRGQEGTHVGVAFALQAARLWILVTLGERWTTRIIVIPGAPLVRAGPYRFMSHPNYAVVAAEIFVLPAAFGLWSFALVFSALDAAALAVRIRAESAALRS